MKIKVYRTVRQVLHRITSRHEFALIKTKNSIRAPKDSYLIRLLSSDASSDKNYIYIGKGAFSRERFDKNECLSEIRRKFPSLGDGEVSFLEISELYEFSEGKILEIDLKGNEMDAVNQKWICECLQFNADEREHYLNDDYSSIKISFSKIAGRKVRQTGEEPVSVDVADYEIYDRMINVFHRIDKEQAYGDACNIEYSIVSDGYEYRYYLTHFFSNHCWNLDPENLLNICFIGEMLSGSCSRENVRFSHPSKITTRKSDGKEYLIEMIGMDNSMVRVKFRGTDTHEPSEGDVAADRKYDNPVDLAMWIDTCYQEIRMA